MLKRWLSLVSISAAALLTLSACASPTALLSPQHSTQHAATQTPQSIQTAPSPTGAQTALTNAAPTGLNLSGIDFLNSREGFIVGSTTDTMHDTGNWLWRTTDAGKSWSHAATPKGQPFAQVHFLNLRDGWAIRAISKSKISSHANVQLWRTTNGGGSWTLQNTAQQSPLANPAQYTIAFPDALTGYALVGNSLLKTDNGGNHWSQVMLPTNKTFPMSIAFATPKRGWMIGEVFEQISKKTRVTPEVLQVYTTADGGKHWTVQYTLNSPYPSLNNTSLSFVNARDGFFLVQNTGNMFSALYRTQNGGKTWVAIQPHLFESRFWPRAIDFVSPTVGWVPVDSGAAPFPGLIAITTDGGKTFHNYGNGNTSIYAVDLLSPTDGWAIGQYMGGLNSYLMHSTTNGGAFTQVLPTSFPLASPTFVSGSIGYGIGSMSDPRALVRTADGGRSWSKVAEIPTQFVGNLGTLSFINSSQGYFLVTSGGAPKLYETMTGGTRWTLIHTSFSSIASSALGSWHSDYLRFWPSGQGIAQVESYPALLIERTQNGGHTWTRFASLSTKSGGFTSLLSFASSDLGYALIARGMQTELYRITPGRFAIVRKWPGETVPVALSASTSHGVIAAVNTNPYSTNPVLAISRLEPGHTAWSTYVLHHSGLANATASFGSTLTARGQDIWWLTATGLLRSTNGGASWEALTR